MPEPDVLTLQTRRQELLEAIAGIGDLRAGSLKRRHRKCGKPNCHCAAEGDPGHGPYRSISRLIKGRMHSRAVPAGAVARTRRQVEERCGRVRLDSLRAKLSLPSNKILPSSMLNLPRVSENGQSVSRSFRANHAASLHGGASFAAKYPCARLALFPSDGIYLERGRAAPGGGQLEHIVRSARARHDRLSGDKG